MLAWSEYSLWFRALGRAGAIARVRPTTTPPAAITSYTLPTIFYYATGKATPLVIQYVVWAVPEIDLLRLSCDCCLQLSCRSLW